MTMKEIRKMTGMTQNEFAKKYGFPLQTLKQWEAPRGSVSHRECPGYVVELTKRAVSSDIYIEFVANYKSMHANKAGKISLNSLKEKVW